jgi:hypothetical protein
MRWLYIVLCACVLTLSSCSPRLTPEDRKRDIQFLAQWAKDCCPFVELNEKYKDCPSYQALLPKYLEFAEQAEDNEEFFQVILSYFNVIGASGHYYLLSEDMLKALKLGSLFGIIKLGDIKLQQYDQAVYWARLSHKISTRAHPPFHIAHRQGKYFTDEYWQYDGTVIPAGSKILKVNGMSCSAYLDFIKENTSLRYDAYSKDWTKEYLLIIDEGPDFSGWDVDFLLPDGSTHSAFVPKTEGFPAPKEDKVKTAEPKENCTCLELTEDVGYIRVKGFMRGALDYVFRGFIKKDRDKIKRFLDRSKGKYRKLIIDIRNNGGGLPQYGYDNLISPFLKEGVRYNQIVGMKKKYLSEIDDSLLRLLRSDCSTEKQHVVNVEEAEGPAGFDGNEWIFYEITRRIEPRNRYNFKGDIYILINRDCVSAADDYANAVKRIGFAKLVGRNTGGGAAGYIGPPVLRLPESGIIFRVETELVINPDGSFNELFGTPPDIKLDPAEPTKSITEEELLKDEWIKKIIDEM